MAFQVVQTLSFAEPIDYSYDRDGDVLYISFGSPAPSVAIQVEDWLGLRIRVSPPALAGMTIVGFQKIFERLNRYLMRELPKRVQRLERVSLTVSYDDQTDTLVMRWKEEPKIGGWFRTYLFGQQSTLSIFEPLIGNDGGGEPDTGFSEAVKNVYVEKTLPSKDIVGIKVLQYTKCGPAAFQVIFGLLIDTIFEPNQKHSENAALITRRLFEHLNLTELSTLAT